jgi:hypothetical protein
MWREENFRIGRTQRSVGDKFLKREEPRPPTMLHHLIFLAFAIAGIAKADPIVVTWTQHLALTDKFGNRVPGTEGDPQAIWQLTLPEFDPAGFKLVSANQDAIKDGFTFPTGIGTVIFHLDGLYPFPTILYEFTAAFTFRGTTYLQDKMLDNLCVEPCIQTVSFVYADVNYLIGNIGPYVPYFAPQDTIVGVLAPEPGTFVAGFAAVLIGANRRKDPP